MWCCVSCYSCTARCPQNIPITDIMYSLKRISIARGHGQDTDAPALAKTFTDLLDKYGRSFELGLASRYYLFNKPLGDVEDGAAGVVDVHPGRHVADAHEDPPVGPVAGHHPESPRVGRCRVKYAYYPGCSLEVQQRRLRRLGSRGGRAAGNPSRAKLTTGTVAGPPSISRRTN